MKAMREVETSLSLRLGGHLKSRVVSDRGGVVFPSSGGGGGGEPMVEDYRLG